MKLLKEEGILKDESEGGKKEEVEAEEKLGEENREKEPNLREIIKEDNLELFQKEFEKKGNDPNFIIKDLIMVHFDHNNKQTVYHLDYLKDEVESMLNHYKKQVVRDKQKAKHKRIEY